jgi:hypothetical protein
VTDVPENGTGMTQREILLEHDRRLGELDAQIRTFRVDNHQEFTRLRLEQAEDRLNQERRFGKIESRLAQGVTVLAIILFAANIVGPIVASTWLAR